MTSEKNPAKREKIENSKNNTPKKDRNLLIHFPIIQLSFMYLLKISAIKSVKISVKTIAKSQIEIYSNTKCINSFFQIHPFSSP